MKEKQRNRSVIYSVLICSGLLILLALGFIVYIIHGPSLKQSRMISISAPPEGDPDAEPVFSFCEDIKCACSCDDPFDPRTVVDSGVYEGLCLNTCLIRSVLLISPEEVARLGYFEPKGKAGNDVQVIFTANIYHQDNDSCLPDFFIGRIEPNGVKEVIFQVEYGGGLHGHAQMRFRFSTDKPVVLVPQGTERERIEISVTDLYYSVEALAPPGIPYKGDYGFRRQYFQRYRMTTQYVRAKRMIKELNHRVWQYKLDLTPEQKAAVLYKAIEQAKNASPYERYHTAKNNCVLGLYRAIDPVISPSWYRKILMYVTNKTLFMPTRMPRHLRYRGIAAKKEETFHLPNLEVELGWEEYINEDLYKK